MAFNLSDPHRALAERLARVGPPESEPAREAAASALERVTRLCHRVLADLLFQELQVSEAEGGAGPCRDRGARPPTRGSFQLVTQSLGSRQGWGCRPCLGYLGA